MESHDQKTDSEVAVKGGAKQRARVRSCELVLRILAVVLTLAASILLGVDKQTKLVPVPVLPTLPPLLVTVTAKWHYLSAFLYFVIANAIASLFGVLSLIFSLTDKGRSVNSALIVVVLDVAMVALLFSGAGAAAAIGVIGYQGNSHLNWNKVCNEFDKFCHQVAASLILSLVGATVFMLLVVLSALGLQKKSK